MICARSMHVYMRSTGLHTCMSAKLSARTIKPAHTDVHAVERAHKHAYAHFRPHKQTLTLSNTPTNLHMCMSARTIGHSRFRTRPRPCIHACQPAQSGAPAFEGGIHCMSARIRRSRLSLFRMRLHPCTHACQPAQTDARAFAIAHKLVCTVLVSPN